MADLDRKKTELSAPASVEKFNSSFVRRQFVRRKEKTSGDNDALSNAGMAAVVFSAALFIGLLVFPGALYSTLPSLPEPYVLPESSRLTGFLAVLTAQTLIGGLFLLLMGKVFKLKALDYNKAITCTYSGAIITAGVLSVAGYIFSVGKYAQALQLLGYAIGLLSYYWAISGVLRTRHYSYLAMQ